MEQMEAPGNTPPTLQDSVVGGDLHTGNIIHNHYHVTQTTPATVPNSQVSAQQPPVRAQHRPAIYVNPSGNPIGTDERNLVLAYLFCIFLGFFGAHRFYLGQMIIGIVYFLTFGLFGIGWFVDLFILPDLVHARNQRRFPP